MHDAGHDERVSEWDMIMQEYREGFAVNRGRDSENNNFTYCHSVDSGGEGGLNWQGCW